MTELQIELLLKQAARIEALEADLAEAECVNTKLFTDYCSRVGAQEAALQQIVQWSEAYPLDIFPEPDMGYARALLAHGGITLDAVSASCMRHVVEGVGKIARAALAPEQDK